MANWELLESRKEGYKVIRRAQCPFCDFIVEFSSNGCDYPPVKCPDCSRELDYERPCPNYEGTTSEQFTCKHRGSCYSCDVFQNAHWRKGEDY